MHSHSSPHSLSARHDIRLDDELYWPATQDLLLVIGEPDASGAMAVICMGTGHAWIENATTVAHYIARGEVRVRRYEDFAVPSEYE